MAQPLIQPGFLPMTVIKEGAVTVDVRVFPFLEDGVNGFAVQQRMQLCALSVLHTVIGPERLWQAIQLALGERLDLVLAGKATVIRRMPVLAGYHRFAAGFTPLN